MTAPTDDDDAFVREVQRQASRRQVASGLGFWKGLGQVGTLGWMIALPAVGGALLGRRADSHYGTGVFWTLSLLAIGLGIGCAAAWRGMNREMHG